ncbi:hypothetical protein TNCV_504971 [Trichonephila clavipes]|nr:hypothetical protein TNCV_504971 [Trichonephila clavipes]
MPAMIRYLDHWATAAPGPRCKKLTRVTKTCYYPFLTVARSDGKQKVWRKSNTAMDVKNLRPTVKYGGVTRLFGAACFTKAIGAMDLIILNRGRYLANMRTQQIWPFGHSPRFEPTFHDSDLPRPPLFFGIPTCFEADQTNKKSACAYDHTIEVIFQIL